MVGEARNSLNLNPEAILEKLSAHLSHSQRAVKRSKLSERLSILLSNALRNAHNHGRRKIEPSDLLIAVFKDI